MMIRSRNDRSIFACRRRCRFSPACSWSGAVVFCISMCAQDSPSISDFLHRTQSEADASRFHDLLGALDAPRQAPHLCCKR